MKYAFYLGCITPYRVPQNEISTRRIAKEFGIELIDLDGFSCCGFPIKNVSYEASLLTAARNLCLAEAEGLNICTICSACTSTLTEANKKLKEDKKLMDEVNKKLSKIGHEFKGTIKVRNFARILYEEIGVEKIREKVKKDLSALNLAVHYGCHYLRPSEIYDGFDDPENPKSLDELVELTGAKSIDYEDRKLCCGNVMVGIDQDVSWTIANQKLEHIKTSDADAMVLICPACSTQYDTTQRMIEAKFNVQYNLPIVYLNQVLGLAFGIDPKELGLNLNRVKTTGLLEKLG
jgi:heterodisulfide reductase subunit B